MYPNKPRINTGVICALSTAFLLLANPDTAYSQIRDSTGLEAPALEHYGSVTTYPSWEDIRNKPATATRWPSWNEVTSKPDFFPARWSEIQGVPETFEPRTHYHDDRYVKLNGVSNVRGTVVYRGEGRIHMRNGVESNEPAFVLVHEGSEDYIGHANTMRFLTHSPGVDDDHDRSSGLIFDRSSGSISSPDFPKEGMNLFSLHARGYRGHIDGSASFRPVASMRVVANNNWTEESDTQTADMILRVRGGGYIALHATRVGIGTSNPQQSFHVQGRALANAWDLASDMRLKTDIRPLDSELASLSRLQGVRFRWKDKESNPGENIGFLAQNVMSVYPELVRQHDNDFLSVNYSGLIAPIIAGVNELNVELEKQKQKTEELKRQVEKLKKSIETSM